MLLNMKRLSIELNATLNKKLEKYIHDHYESPFGKKEIVLHDALVKFLNAHGTTQPQVEEIKLAESGTLTATEDVAAGASAQPKARETGNHLRPRNHLSQQPKVRPPKPYL
jgi:hypothetical protein